MIFLISLSFFSLVGSVRGLPTDGQNRILSESFSSGSLNTSLWNYGYPWGSFYVHRANTVSRQVRITPENLMNITATRERSISLGLSTEYGPIDLDFTSGAVNTNGKLSVKNGYVEVTVRVPDTPSTWPLIFLVPEDQGQVPMLTLMDVYDDRSRYAYGFKYTNEHGAVEKVEEIAENRSTSDAFHRYGLDWGYDQITWYYDGHIINSMIKSDELQQVNGMCLVIGLGVGGKSQQTPVDPQTYPTTMSINLVEFWQPKYDGFYKFQNVQTGQLMEIESASYRYGARILQWPDNGGNWQVWHVQYAGHGQYRLLVAHSRQSLDAQGSDTDDGAKLLQWPYHNGPNQLWKIQEVTGTTNLVQLINVNTLIESDLEKYVSVPAVNTQAGVQLELWQDFNSNLQKWRMIRV